MSQFLEVRALGCHGGVAPDYQTSCYSVNGFGYVDAGSICSALRPESQFDVEHVFITHPHLDHIKDLCFLIENTFEPHRKTLNIYSTKEIIKDLKDFIFNDVIWPDFSKIPVQRNPDKYVLKFHDIEDKVELNGIRFTPFRANHPGHAVGYLVDNGSEQVIFTGDTGPHQLIWKTANACSNLRAVFTEITFPNRLDGLARASGHMTINQLVEDIKNLKKKVPVYISHFKPMFLSELLKEFESLAPPEFHLLHEDDVLTWR